MIPRLVADDMQGILSGYDDPVAAKINALITQANGLTASCQVKSVDGARVDTYAPDGSLAFPYKKIQSAIDAITDASYNKKYVINIAPGTYVENVVMKRHVYLNGLGGFGANYAVKITPTSGIALSVPYRESYLNGIFAKTDSGVAEDAAMKIIDDGLGMGQHETFLFNFDARSTNVGHAVWVEPNPFGEAVIGIYGAIDGGPGGHAIYADGGGFIWFLGGGGGELHGIKLVNGAFMMTGAEVGLNASTTDPTAWALEVDGGMFVALGNMIDGFNGIDVKNGGFAFLVKLINLGGFAGIPMRTAAGTTLILGDVSFGPGSPPWQGWQVAGASVLLGDAGTGMGTTGVGGPDQRPTTTSTPPMGFLFFALDIALAGAAGTWLTWNGAQWVDSVGGVVP